MTKLNVGDFIRVSSVSAPKGTEIIAPNDFNILTVIGERGAVVEEEEGPAEADAEAPAEAGGE